MTVESPHLWWVGKLVFSPLFWIWRTMVASTFFLFLPDIGKHFSPAAALTVLWPHHSTEEEKPKTSHWEKLEPSAISQLCESLTFSSPPPIPSYSEYVILSEHPWFSESYLAFGPLRHRYCLCHLGRSLDWWKSTLVLTCLKLLLFSRLSYILEHTKQDLQKSYQIISSKLCP